MKIIMRTFIAENQNSNSPYMRDGNKLMNRAKTSFRRMVTVVSHQSAVKVWVAYKNGRQYCGAVDCEQYAMMAASVTHCTSGKLHPRLTEVD